MKWMVSRVTDLLIALIIMTLLIWAVLKQPTFSWGVKHAPIALSADQLNTGVKAIMALSDETLDVPTRLKTANHYFVEQLSSVGEVVPIERGTDGTQYALKLNIAGTSDEKLVVVLHHVVTDKPVLELAETTQGIIEWAKSLGKTKAALSVELMIFLHSVQDLPQGLINASLYQAEVLNAVADKDKTLVLVFIPGMAAPEVAYAGGYSRFFSNLMPKAEADLALFGRLEDISELRTLKKAIQQNGLEDVDSINIPVHFAKLPPSVLKSYWDKHIPAILVRPGILIKQPVHPNHITFVSALNGVVRQGL